MERKKVTKESRRIGFIILFLSVFMGFKPAIAQENIKEVELNKKDTTGYPTRVEVMPQFPDGDEALIKFLQENLVYPPEAKENGIEGRVIVSFIVGRDGSVTEIKVIKNVHPLLDEEALRVVKMMPNWKPGKLNGKTVPVRFQLPIDFKLT